MTPLVLSAEQRRIARIRELNDMLARKIRPTRLPRRAC